MFGKKLLIVCGLLFFGLMSINAQTKFELDGNKLKLPKPIIFPAGSDKINLEESEESLKYVKEYLNSKKYITVLRIEVHAQRSGNEERLQTLTEKRALAVANWLVENGIDCHRILPVGFGSTKPLIDPNSGPEASHNNRVEFHNAELSKHAIGGLPLDSGGKVIKDFCKADN
jgi:OmpA-OmpF porin, OOP family